MRGYIEELEEVANSIHQRCQKGLDNALGRALNEADKEREARKELYRAEAKKELKGAKKG
jgi:hypothetical protein